MGIQPVKDVTIDQNFRYLERLIRQAKVVEQISGDTTTVDKTTVFRRNWVGNGLYWTGHRLSVLPAPDLGITVSAAGVSVKLKTGGGITVDSNGLYLNLLNVWPVGSIFLSVIATNPATLLGVGTWVRIAEGQMLAGFKTGDPDFGTVEGIGGAKTATPDAHAGGAVVRDISSVTVDDHGNHIHSDVHTHDIAHAHGTSSNVGTGAASVKDANLGVTASGGRSAASTGNETAALTHTVNEPNAGTGHDHGFTQPSAHAAMSILNPYFTIYVWKRTA